MSNLIVNPYSFAGDPAVLSYVGTAANTGNTLTYTFSSASMVSAGEGGHIIVTYNTRASGGITITSLTVDGDTATEVVSMDDGGAVSGVFIVAHPGVATADIVLTFPSAPSHCNIGWYHAADLSSATATATATNGDNPMSTTIDCNAGGLIVAAGSGFASGSPSSNHTWAGVTERYDATNEFSRFSGGGDDFETAQSGLTVSVTSSGTAPTTTALSVAAFR